MAFVGLNHFMYSLLIASVTFLFGLSGVVNQLSHRFTSFEYAYYFFFFFDSCPSVFSPLVIP
jgi:hypothetical protein